jgi:hypothetical protein
MEMRRFATPLDRQMNLSLLDARPLGACDQQKELTLALVELLIDAAQGSVQTREDGDQNESTEAHV